MLFDQNQAQRSTQLVEQVILENMDCYIQTWKLENTVMDFHFALKIQLKPQINCKIRSQKIL